MKKAMLMELKYAYKCTFGNTITSMCEILGTNK